MKNNLLPLPSILSCQSHDLIQQRPNYIDWAKVFGIYTVLVGHYVYFIGIPFEQNSGIWKLTHFVTLYHMPLFFFISGVLHKSKELPIGKIITNNITSLLLPYIVLSMLVGSVYYAIDSSAISNISSFCLGIITGGDFYHKATLYPVGPIWFVYSLFFIKVLVSIFTHNSCRVGFRIIIGFLSFLLCFYTIHKNYDYLPFRIDSSSVGFIFYILGYALRNKISYLLNNRKIRIWILVFSLCVILFANAFYLDNSIRQGLSINVCYFGRYPFLFLLTGLAGTMIYIICGFHFSHFKSQKVLQLSNGLIITLATHKVLFFLAGIFVYSQSVIAILLISFIVLVLSYGLIKLANKYFPIALGYRKISRL